ncbi:MAG TPA: SIMPL domain-containing protein [Xanthobacteraceae bacterium]|jgi:hypothetical protein|nr:SIMPL domain-containing protein [Xanthobacteraceae bacterium]
MAELSWSRRSLGLRLLLVMGIVVVTHGAWAAEPQTEPVARIVVTGTGSISVSPDYADLNCGATSKAKTAKEATDANTKIVNAIIATLRDAGVEQKDIQTAYFSLQPNYMPPQPNTEPKLTGFAVSNRLSIIVRDTAKLGDILDRVIAAGATEVGQIDFGHNDVSKLLDLARTAAVADARRKAELYAQAAGLTLGGVVFVSEDGDRPVLFAPKALARTASATVPVAIGQDTLNVSVSVGFDVSH